VWLTSVQRKIMSPKSSPTVLERVVDNILAPKDLDRQIVDVFQGHEGGKGIAVKTKLNPKFGLYGSSKYDTERLRPKVVDLMLRPVSPIAFAKECGKRGLTQYVRVIRLIKQFEDEKEFYIRIRHELKGKEC